MRNFIVVSSLLVVAFVATSAAPARADECDKLTYLTFNTPVAKAYGMFSTTVAQRSTATMQPEVLFAERPAGFPEAIRAWFYPGDTTGDGLIYSKKQTIAK